MLTIAITGIAIGAVLWIVGKALVKAGEALERKASK